MAIKPTGPGDSERPNLPSPRTPQKAVARKPGHVIDSPGEQHEEHVAELQHQAKSGYDGPIPKQQEAEAKKKTKEVKRVREDLDDDGQKRRRDEAEPEEPKKGTTPGHLSHDANYYRSQHARKLGLDQTPGVDEIVIGQESDSPGESLGAILPSARARAHPDLPEVEVRPPDFLKPLEAMFDIYQRTRGRLSRKTKELLTGPDLEDLLALLRAIYESPTLSKSAEARLKAALHSKLKDDPGPLLLGLNDPRLSEPWRVFLDGWEIWVPKGDGTGVELFWEGEAEDDDGNVVEMTQSLLFADGSLTLHTILGELVDKVTFDGEAFYRFKHEL
ncbi:MAG: hypothetical protein IPG45_36760 [Deltaproteobacteria bacterium]|nr:hypothetical protein [Deltaproteobacteria bacterium]